MTYCSFRVPCSNMRTRVNWFTICLASDANGKQKLGVIGDTLGAAAGAHAAYQLQTATLMIMKD